MIGLRLLRDGCEEERGGRSKEERKGFIYIHGGDLRSMIE
jgi:hypothetical protein